MTKPSAPLQLNRWAKSLGELPEQVLAEAVAETREFLRDKLRANASKGGARGLKVRSGRGIRSIRTYVKVQGNKAELSAGANFYMWVHNAGATIHPKVADRLHFFIPGVGFRTARKVVLPARHWVDDALEDTRKEFPRYVYKALERFTRE